MLSMRYVRPNNKVEKMFLVLLPGQFLAKWLTHEQTNNMTGNTYIHTHSNVDNYVYKNLGNHT